MGCRHSIYASNESVECNKNTYSALGLNESNIYELYEIFKSVDIDHCGLIDVVKLMIRLQLKMTPFSKRVFQHFATDSSGKLDFWEFVISTWNCCTLGKTLFGR
jgi:Ca2+-binding EF-hand superfamily protein